jgi:hypothetical protein
MSENPSPIASEFTTIEEAEAYDRWFRAKVQKSLGDEGTTAIEILSNVHTRQQYP